MSDFSIETPSPDDWDALHRVADVAFLSDHSDERSEVDRRLTELDRTLVARQDGEIVGTAGIQSRRLAVPGGVLPAAHVTMVAVAPTARRQGILTGFMRRQFSDALAAGEPVAVLWATEGRIYQRFGYGLAATRMSLSVETNEVRLTVPAGSGRLREGSPGSLRPELAAVFAEVYPRRPGWSERAERHWDHRLADPDRNGGAHLRAVVHFGDDGRADGYALWRPSRRWTDAGAAGKVLVVEQVSTNPAAYAALWQYLMSVDLTRTVEVWLTAVDEPLLYAVSDPRRLGARLADALWLRVLDVPAALAARRYATEVDVVLEVTDTMLPANQGRWRLRGSPEGASCVSTVDEPDVSCDVKSLGVTYLGGASLSTLAATGQVIEHVAGALARTDAGMRWPTAPSSPEVF